MEVLQESSVRQMHFKQGMTEIVVDDGTYITQQARDFIREKRMTLVEGHDRAKATDVKGPGEKAAPVRDGKALQNRDIRPAKEMGQGYFLTEDGRRLEKKPEHMTHLYGNVLVPKSHPRIILRGKLDSLEAEIIMVQIRARLGGMQILADELEELLEFCRKLLACEVTGSKLPEWKLLGMDEADIRIYSQRPKEYLEIDHLLPDSRLGETVGGLNLLRAHSREVELAALNAFMRDDGQVDREDLIQGLNRLSSAFYIMMLRQVIKSR